MLSTNNTIYFSHEEITQLAFILNTDEENIKALRHRPDELLEIIERLIENNERLDSPLKMIRAYFLPEWKIKLSIYKE